MEWGELLPDDGGVVFLWDDPDAPSGLGVRFLGWPKNELVEHEGLWLTLEGLTAEHDVEELQRLAGLEPPTGEAVDLEVEDPTLEDLLGDIAGPPVRRRTRRRRTFAPDGD